jgi:hypothetical protein
MQKIRLFRGGFVGKVGIVLVAPERYTQFRKAPRRLGNLMSQRR